MPQPLKFNIFQEPLGQHSRHKQKHFFPLYIKPKWIFSSIIADYEKTIQNIFSVITFKEKIAS